MMIQIWHDMFYPELPILEKILRPIIVYTFLIIGLRLAGKRELAQINPFDLVVLMTLSNTVQNAIIGNDNSLTGGLIGAATLLVVNYMVVRFLYRHEKLTRLIEGESDVLIEHGEIQTQNLQTELITLEEIEAAARRQGFSSLTEVEKAVLESSGTISFMRKEPSSEELRHSELLERFEHLIQEMVQIRTALIPPQ